MIATATEDGQDERQRRQVGEELAASTSPIWSIEAETTAARPTMRPPERSTPREMSTMPAPSATRARVEEFVRMLRTLFADDEVRSRRARWRR